IYASIHCSHDRIGSTASPRPCQRHPADDVASDWSRACAAAYHAVAACRCVALGVCDVLFARLYPCLVGLAKTTEKSEQHYFVAGQLLRLGSRSRFSQCPHRDGAHVVLAYLLDDCERAATKLSDRSRRFIV